MCGKRRCHWVALIGGVIAILAGAAGAGLVAHYKLDETSGLTAVDSSGKHNDAPIAGSPTWVAGKYGGAMQFSGSSPVTIPAANLAMTSTTGSVAFWMNAGTGSTTIRTMFWAGDNTTGTGFGPENELHVHIEGTVSNVWQGGEVSFFIYGGVQIHSDPAKGAAGNAPVDPKLVNDSQWHHVAAVWEATSGKLYLDGSLISQATYTSTGFQLSQMCLGKMISGNRQYDGILDDVRIYDHALTDAEVRIAFLGGVVPGSATSPSPEDEATDVVRDTLLQWSPGPFADTHDVYLGTNFNDVNDADRIDPMNVLISQGQSDSTFDPGVLQFGQTYYWRVDEVNALPSTKIFKGDVWSFTVEPFAYKIDNITATASSTAAVGAPQSLVDGSGLDDADRHSMVTSAMWLAPKSADPTWVQFAFDRVYKLYEMWVWNYNSEYEKLLGFGIKEAALEYSVDGANWTAVGDIELAQAPGAEGYAHSTTVDFDGVMAKCVRLTVKSGWGGTGQHGLSEVRFYCIPVLASRPSPASGAGDVAPETILSWRSGREAGSHWVYLSDDSQAVADNIALVDTTTIANYAPSALNLGTTYFWKIDEVNEAQTPSLWEGDVWSFTTTASLVIDDFEGYTDEEPGRVFDAWLDGWNIPANGSQVGYGESPFTEKTTVHGGKQSMPFSYDNTANVVYSEAQRTFDSPWDWTVRAADALALYVMGNASNGLDRFYVTIQDSVGKNVTVPNPEPSILLSDAWQAWIIPLNDLSAAGVNIRSIKKMIIGVGDKTGASSGAKGQILIDDIIFGKLAAR